MIDATKFILRNCTWLLAGLVLAASPANARFDDEATLIGEVIYVSYGYCPHGYAEAKGQSVSIEDNYALYTLLRDQSPGDGHSFNLPKISGPSASNGPALIACIAMKGLYPSR